MVEQRILDAFQMMWGPFPGPAMLVHKNRTVLAINDSAQNSGVPVGIKCFTLNSENGTDNEPCKQCKANDALRSGEAICSHELVGGRQLVTYWIPLKDVPDVYIRFGIVTAKSMAASASGAERDRG